MRLTFGHEGDWVVDPRELAARLDVRVRDLKRMKRQGQVDAKLATGDGDDVGLSRVTVRLPDRGWSGTFDQSGAFISKDAWRDQRTGPATRQPILIDSTEPKTSVFSVSSTREHGRNKCLQTGRRSKRTWTGV